MVRALRRSSDPSGSAKELRVLDGFLLLELAGVDLPQSALQTSLSSARLGSVVGADMAYFTSLHMLDASENALQVFALRALPALRHLRLCHNRLEEVHAPDGEGFPLLETLDLAYNSIVPASLPNLRFMGCLRELDLSGNGLRTLPPDMALLRVETLTLAHNRLDEEALSALSHMPALALLCLAHNFVASVPAHCCQGFRVLAQLDLSFNYVSREADLAPLAQLSRLAALMLYGNPLLGPSGEDPLHIYTEQLDELCPNVKVHTEAPRVRKLRRGQHLGRLALYKDVPIILVRAGEAERTLSSEWRLRGNFALFAEQALVPAEYADHTFLTSVEGAGRGKGQEAERAADTQAKVSAVMRQVMAGLHMGESEGVASIRDRLSVSTGGAKEQGAEEGVFSPTPVPHHLFVRASASSSLQQVKAHTALKTLEYSLLHPLTDHDAAAEGADRSYVRPTAASAAKKTPVLRRGGVRAVDAQRMSGFISGTDLLQAEAGRSDTLERIEQVLRGLEEQTMGAVRGTKKEEGGYN